MSQDSASHPRMADPAPRRQVEGAALAARLVSSKATPKPHEGFLAIQARERWSTLWGPLFERVVSSQHDPSR